MNSNSNLKVIPTDTTPLNDDNNAFYTNELNQVAKKIIYDNDIGDLKRSINVRYSMYIISIITNLLTSLSLSANIIINIIQNMPEQKENLLIYQIVSLSIFIFGLGLNYFSNTIDSNMKTQQKNLMIKFGINSNNYNDQDAINFDQTFAKQIIKV